MSEVRFSTLEECLEKVIDYRGRTPKKLGKEWSEKGYRALSANNIKFEGLVREDNINYGDEELYSLWMRDEVQRGDILLTSEAPSGQALLWDSDEKIILSQRLFALRVDKTIADNKYLKYYIQSPQGQRSIIQNNSGSTVFGISAKTFKNIMIVLPDIQDQRKIGDILYTLDSKIALNNQINAELETMAKTLYDYWFVQFDFPDENGKPYKSSGGKMVYNDQLKREIPEGWEVKTLNHFLAIRNGKDHKDLSEGDYSVYGSGGLMRSVDQYLYSGESVLIPRKGTLNNIMYVDENFWTVDTMYYTEVIKKNSALYAYYSIKDIDFTKLNTGTGVPSMTAGILNSLKILEPPKDLLTVFDDKIRISYRMIKLNQQQNQELTQLRDWLLPMLMNRQVRVK